MKILLTLFVTCAVLPFFLNRIAAQKVLQTAAVTGDLILDGELKEAFWQTLQAADSFTINYPNFGDPSAFETTVKLAYDDQAVYIGAVLRDVTPDSVLAILSQRDDFGNADWFGVLIDPYGGGQNAFGFYVTAAGVELDLLVRHRDAGRTAVQRQ